MKRLIKSVTVKVPEKHNPMMQSSTYIIGEYVAVSGHWFELNTDSRPFKLYECNGEDPYRLVAIIPEHYLIEIDYAD